MTSERLGPHEWWLSELAKVIPVSAGKLADRAWRGWLHSRGTSPQWYRVLRADELEVGRLRKLAACLTGASWNIRPNLPRR